MAKKKPNFTNVRQGQTIYIIDRHIEYGPEAEPEIKKKFLYSENEKLPPINCIIERMPVSYARYVLKKYGNRDCYFSRRKAISAL